MNMAWVLYLFNVLIIEGWPHVSTQRMDYSILIYDSGLELLINVIDKQQLSRYW
jgi:hypothetical protein